MASWWLAFHRRLQFGKQFFAENVSRWKTLTICLPESWLMSLTFKDPKYLSTLSSNIKSFCTKENHVKCTFAAFWSRIETTRAGFWQSVGWTKCRQCCPAVCWKSRKVCEGFNKLWAVSRRWPVVDWQRRETFAWADWSSDTGWQDTATLWTN